MERLPCKLVLFSVWSLVLVVWTHLLSAAGDPLEGPQRIVLQVSSSEPERQQLTLRVAGNLVEDGQGTVEVVAFGRGVDLLLAGREHAATVAALLARGVRFQACRRTLNALDQAGGGEPVLIEGVQVTPSGVRRLAQLSQLGYTVISP